MADFKPVALEKHEFENRQEKNKNCFLRNIGYQKSFLRKNIRIVQSNSHPKVENCQINFMEKFKFVVFHHHALEYRDISLLIAFSASF